MKYIKTYEAKKDFFDINREEKNLRDRKYKFLSIIDDYMNLHKEKWDDWDIYDYRGSYDFDIDDDEFVISYDYVSDDNIYDSKWVKDSVTLSGEDYEDFLRYIEDPELYDKIKKYNL